MTDKHAQDVTWNAEGLVPVIVQDRLTGEIRMLAYANADALAATEATGHATFYSRSRKSLWVKGATSGNTIRVTRVLVDCDADTLVYQSEPAGPSCHTGKATCFFRSTQHLDVGLKNDLAEQTMLGRLEATLEDRKTASGDESYTKSLYEGGAAKIGGKLREEADELARALASESDARVAGEAADVIFHLVAGLRLRNVPFRAVLAELDARFGKSGHDEKASRGQKK